MSRILLAVLVIAGFAVDEAAAQIPLTTDRVEEDWRLIVATPDVDGVGPQITTSMCPLADRSRAPFVAFDLNYREYPSFSAGGYQAQVWSNDQLLQNSTGGKTDQLATANETITWTQRMSLSSGQVSYAIVSGSSTTWGNFGQSVNVGFSTSLATLSGYDPSSSVSNSGASWQVNNVQELTLVTVRYYAGGVLLSTDSTARTIVSNGASTAQASAGGPGPMTRLTLLASSLSRAPMPAALGSRRGKGARAAIG